MHPHSYVTLVTVLALVAYIWMALRVAFARRKSGIHAPAMTGDPVLERHLRVQANTLEWLPVFLAGLWLSAQYWPDLWVALAGVVWVLGRIVYALGYVADPKKREIGFLIQFAVAVGLLAAAAVGAVRMLLVAGA